MTRRPIVVVLGLMSKHPVPGVAWQTLHYLLGFERLGLQAYYVEAGGHQPSAMLLESDASDRGDRSLAAAGFLDGVFRRFGLGDRWAFQALHAGRRCYGLSEAALARLWREADLIVNLHGGTTPRPEHAATGRLIYLETDPVLLQMELHRRLPGTLAFLEPHAAFFTFGENYGTGRCTLPVTEGLSFLPTRQPVVRSLWQSDAAPGAAFTTIGNWAQRCRPVRYRGEGYHWCKHLEFERVIDLPRRSGASFELALSLASVSPDDAARLAAHGWSVRDALTLARDMDGYRAFITASRAEFTVAKEQNIRFRTGWFSDRSACYLAAGRAVITHDTGFSDLLPSGEGLFGFSTIDEAAAAVAAVAADPARHGRAAEAIARDYFNHEVVLGRLLADVAVSFRAPRSRARSPRPTPAGEAIEGVRTAISAVRETIRARRATYERARDDRFAERAQLHRRHLNEARARLRELQRELDALEDRKSVV